MKKSHRFPRWLPVLILSSLLSVAIVLFATLGQAKPYSNARLSSLSRDSAIHVDGSGVPKPPRLAYLISGTKGDTNRLKRVLQAVYHPWNFYLLHLDLEAPDEERLELAKFVQSEKVFGTFDNVRVVGNANLVTYKGPTMVASTLHAVAILLRQAKEWNWFINLSASDYPLMPQDDILHVLSYLPREFNFIEHTSKIGWKEYQRARPIILDPGLYDTKKSGVFWTKEKRSMPASFKLFTGSAWVVLTRQFLEFCIWGFDNLPRTLLMYYTNFLSSPEGYFHTVICNSKDYQNTTINHDLHYIKWHHPPRQHPMTLRSVHFDAMVASGAPFARKFVKDDRVLDKIDRELLGRSGGRFAPGGWCTGNSFLGRDPCASYGFPEVLKPTVNSRRLEMLLLKVLDPEKFRSSQCK
ncbi:beta-glucuronosyltransferase GlcAT14C-like [Aristolochia californica]|uniref:beta-glucuronosyltransferase GlcAT14C-like n=1 Tax=Aristolochia californica TaxID=171875 RepID=UPI0035D574A5